MTVKFYKNKFLPSLLTGLLFASFFSFGSPSETEKQEEKLDISEIVIHHVLDDYVWHFFDGPYGTLPLPVILYSSNRGLDVFLSSHFYDEHHSNVPYRGYKLEGSRIHPVDTDEWIIDLSITKNVAMLFITALLLFIILVMVAKSSAVNKGKAPRGLQSFVEPIILFVVNTIIKPNAGPKYHRYTSYLLTLFFFILTGNLLGLLPGAGNLMGNIAVTMTLAVFTFLVTNISGNKNYWSHIFWTPGVPLVLRPILLVIEIIGLFTKPFALMIRLFAAITAGHIVLLSLLCIIFMFHSYIVGVGSSFFVLLISVIELLVAGIQAYVFTLFSSLYIGMATVEYHKH